MLSFSAFVQPIGLSPGRSTRSVALCLGALLVCGLSIAQTPNRAEPTPLARGEQASLPSEKARRVALLLPTEQPLLRRAAQTVREGVRAVFAKSGVAIDVQDCGYGVDGVALAYQRCVNEDTEAVIGPLGRSEVTALVTAKLPLKKPTLMLSPLGIVPPVDFYVLAPELESEAEAIAKQSLEDACRKPVLVETQGALATRIAVAINGFFRSGGVSTQLLQQELGPRERWPRIADGWRRDGVDCILFAGGGATLGELRAYLRGITIYITSASYEAELDRVSDWTGVRIADSPWLLDVTRADFAAVAPTELSSPTLARLYALGVDAARLLLAAEVRKEVRMPSLRDPSGTEKTVTTLVFPVSLDGAIGQLRLRDGQYQRTPTIGEFRGRTANALGL
jgi:outer membrane PBP1 activator LpoA protein